MDFPIGSYYINETDGRNPSILLGYGTWEPVTDVFLVGHGTNYKYSGGAATHTHPLSSNGHAAIATFSAGGNSFVDAKLITNLPSWTSNARVSSGGALSGVNHTDGTPLGGSTDSGSSIPPYRAPFIWKRLADYTFTKSGTTPIMTPAGWEGSALCEPNVMLESGTFKMWYRGNSGSNSKIGYATSSDGISWTKHGSNPILTVTGGVAYPFVLKIGSIYYMYAVKISDDKLYRWSSSDGLSWSIDNGGAAVLTGHIICNPSVYYDAADTPKYRMLFEVLTGGAFKLRYAYSSDGLSWTVDSTNPVYPPEAGNPSGVIKVGSNYFCWTGEHFSNGWQISLITSTDWTTWYKVSTELIKTDTWEDDITDPGMLLDVSGQSHQCYMWYIGNQADMGVSYIDMPIATYLAQWPS